MKPVSLADLSRAMSGELKGPADTKITGFATDSREVKPGDLFIAIRGEQVDGHKFIDQAVRSGAAAALTEREVDAPHILVEDVVKALGNYGSHVRARVQRSGCGHNGQRGQDDHEGVCRRGIESAWAGA